MAIAFNLTEGQRVQRKKLITVAEWPASSSGSPNREILGVRTEDSSIEFNPDVQTVTDILGITYTDVNKTEPQQSFDPFNIVGGSKLSEYLVMAALNNDIEKYNNAFNVYIITAFLSEDTNKYFAVKHTGCSIIPQSIGGDAYTVMPIEVHYSNNITTGTVDKLTKDFEFSANE